MTTAETRPMDWLPNFSDYIARFPQGVMDEYGYKYFLTPAEFEVRNATELTVGFAGCDGIEFRLRAHASGVWAFYPIEERYQLLGHDIADVAAGWLAGTVHV
jgi:hypothetical protein